MKATYSVRDLISVFARHGNPEIAEGQEAYMKHKFEFFGIKAPERRTIQRPFLLKKNLPPKKEACQIIEHLWDEPQRELHYFAIELVNKYHRQFIKADIVLLEHLITQNSWWDTVDFIASNVVGSYFLMFPEERHSTIEKWLRSENLWLQRTCLLFQLKYKENLDTRKLEEVIHRLQGSKEFFINKAIGWILREYSKTDPDWVIRFVDKTPLSPLSHREALKVVNR